ncbi:MAG: nuclear transport factor 2 family protein [Gemmatimonadota bacterium]
MPTNVLSLLAVFALLSSGAPIAGNAGARSHPASAQGDSLEQILIAAERQSWIAWQQRDGKFFQDFLSEDHVEVGTTGLATKSQVVAFVGSPACVVKSYSVDHFRITRFDDNTALLTYRAEQDTMCGSTAAPSPAWVSSLFVRRHEKWMNALYQQTKVE